MALNAAQKETIRGVFTQTLNDARTPLAQLGLADNQRPQLTQFTGANVEENVRQWRAAENDFNNRRAARAQNPLAREVARIEGEVETQRRAGVPEAQLTVMRDMSYRDLEARFMDGADKDIVNEQRRAQNQQNLIQSALSFNIVGVITSLVKMISGANEMLDVPGQLAQQALSGRGVDPGRAVQSSFLTSGLTSGFMALGNNVQDPNMQRFIGTTVAATIAPPAAQQPAQPAQPTQQTTQQPAQPPQPFTAANGTMPAGPSATPTVRPAQTAGVGVGG